MTIEPEICASFWKCIYDFQTLISGMLAILAAALSVFVVWHAATLPIKAQVAQAKDLNIRRRKFLNFTLSQDLRLLATRAKQAEGTIKVTIAAQKDVTENTRNKTRLRVHPITNEWEFMSLIPSDVFNEIVTFRREVEDHNFDMDRAGGVFGDANFRKNILDRLVLIEKSAQRISSIIFND